MLRTISTRSLLLFFSFGVLCVLCVPGVPGQTCSLRLNVSNSANGSPVMGATATALRAQKRYRGALLKNNMPYFSALPVGTYAVTVEKGGYSRKTISVRCDTAGKSVGVKMAPVGVRLKVFDEMPVLPPMISSSDSGKAPAIAPLPPSPSSAPSAVPKTITKGVVNSSAISLPQPAYPPAAKAVGAGGLVNVEVLIGEEGNVISAHAVSGHPFLRRVSETAAQGAKFRPTLLSGVPVKVSGIIVYNFK